MTADQEFGTAARRGLPKDRELPVVLMGRLISLRFVMSALRRRRKVWLSLAALGLMLGLAYHVVVPRSYSASATVYLAHAPGTDDAVEMANDLALLQTTSVAQRAIDSLGETKLSPTTFLGKQPGIAVSDNVMAITVAGPTKAEAVRRANATATAFLAFRSAQEDRQTGATIKALNQQIAALNQQVKQLSTEIAAIGQTPGGQSLASLEGDQSADTNEVTTLEQTVQSDQIADLAVASGSRIVTPAAAVHVSTVKLLGLSGISGLIGGLVLGMAIVGLQAIVSDRVRRRDEMASLLAAPVTFSLPPFRRPRTHAAAWVKRMVATPGEEVGALASHFRQRGLPPDEGNTLLVIAIDDVEVPAAALATLAWRLAAEGNSVALIDLTERRILDSSLGEFHPDSPNAAPVAGHVSVVAPSIDDVSAAGALRPWSGYGRDADYVLVLATVDPGGAPGISHRPSRRW